MKGDRIFEILGLLDDKLIEEAEESSFKNKTNKVIKWGFVAACFLTLFLIGKLLPMRSENICESAEGFMHYAGPIMPISIENDLTDIDIERKLTLDFNDFYKDKELKVYDEYSFKNTSKEDKKIEIIYPFISNIQNSKKYIPKLSTNNKALDSEVIIGQYTGAFVGMYGDESKSDKTYNLESLSTWDEYKNLLSDDSYYKDAIEKNVFKDQLVTVYSFENVIYPEENHAATIALEFKLPKDSQVMTFGINGASIDSETREYIYDYFVRHNRGQKIIIIGEAPKEYKVNGYENGACEKEDKRISATVSSQTKLLSEVIKECIMETKERYNDLYFISDLINDENIYNSVIKMLNYTEFGDKPKDRYSFNRLDDLISESLSMDRIMFLRKEIEIKSGESLKLKGVLIKDSSYDFAGAESEGNKGVSGFDLITSIKSQNKFNKQKAEIILPNDYIIVNQNFGFDKENSKIIDLKDEYYYIDIKSKNK